MYKIDWRGVQKSYTRTECVNRYQNTRKNIDKSPKTSII